MKTVNFRVNPLLNLYYHFLMCTEIHRYSGGNPRYKQETYHIFEERAYEEFKDLFLVYLPDLLSKIAADHPYFDQEYVSGGIKDKLVKFLEENMSIYSPYWKERSNLLEKEQKELERDWHEREELFSRLSLT